MTVDVYNIFSSVSTGSGHINSQNFIDNFTLTGLSNMAIVKLGEIALRFGLWMLSI